MAKRKKSEIDANLQETDGVRLNKYLSDAGVCSRREADKFIAEGLVLIDGEVAITGSKVTPDQVVTLKGKEVKREEKLVLIAFHKPRGIVCTTDKRDKDNIIDYIKYSSRIFPIGRLDKDSEGLILLTNDGNIVNKILRAGNNHEKEYIVTVNKPITSEFLEGMAAGVPILDTVTKPCIIKALNKTTFQIIITQGLNRQIRRMCEYFDFKVLTLKRVRIMNINLGHLQLGGYRNVTDKELAGLNDLIADSDNAPDLEEKPKRRIDKKESFRTRTSKGSHAGSREIRADKKDSTKHEKAYNKKVETKNNNKFEKKSSYRMDSKGREGFDTKGTNRTGSKERDRFDSKGNNRTDNKERDRFDRKGNNRTNSKERDRFDSKENNRTDIRERDRFVSKDKIKSDPRDKSKFTGNKVKPHSDRERKRNYK